MNARLKFVASLAALAVIGLVIINQRIALNKVSEQNTTLQTQVAELQDRPAPKPLVDANELKRLQDLAAEVPKLRGELARLRSTQKESAAVVAAAEAQKSRMARQLQTAEARRKETEQAAAEQREQVMLRRKHDEMKTLGLGFHNALKGGQVPRSMDEFIRLARLPAEQAAAVRSRFLFFDHSRTDPAEKGRFILADRVPTQRLSGDQVWSYTMIDGSSLMLTTPPPPDGILRNLPQPVRPRTLPGR